MQKTKNTIIVDDGNFSFRSGKCPYCGENFYIPINYIQYVFNKYEYCGYICKIRDVKKWRNNGGEYKLYIDGLSKSQLISEMSILKIPKNKKIYKLTKSELKEILLKKYLESMKGKSND